MREPPFIRLGLLDAMGTGNLGDAAIQNVVIANIKRRLPAARIVGFSYIPSDTRDRHGIPCHSITRDSGNPPGSRTGFTATLRRVPGLRRLTRLFAGLWQESLFLGRTYRALRTLDLLIMSGGGQLCELWGGPWAHLYNLFKFSLLTKLAGTRLWYLNVGAEPLDHRWSRFFAKSAVRLADYVSFRDDYSQELMERLGARLRTAVSVDPVYALEPSAYVDTGSARSSAPRVGINPIGFCDPRIWPRKAQPIYEAYLEKLTRFALWLLAQGYRLTLFTTSPHADGYAIADLKRGVLERMEASEAGTPMADLSPPAVKEALCQSVQEVLGEMSDCDFIVTSRYHGVIFSHLLRKPVIALGYQGKSDAAMKPAGLQAYSASVETFHPHWMVETFQSLVRDREIIKSRESRIVDQSARKLNRQFDELFASPALARNSTPQGVVA